MPDPRSPSTSWRTRLVQPEVHAPAGFRSLAMPVYRGSTTLFDSAADTEDTWRTAQRPYRYGLYGTPTAMELAARMRELEGAAHTFLTPGGQAALALVDLALLGAGDHVLLPENVYAPGLDVARRTLQRLGIEAEVYDPLAGAGVARQFKPNTRLVWCESPGSITMEVQDVRAIAQAAHAHGALVAVDNTYAAGVLFDAFAHGADVACQALTKYVGGHSDLLLGSVSLRDDTLYERIGDTHQLLGMGVSPDDCSLALRGLQTLPVRLDALERSTLAVAHWLAQRPEVKQVLHPALPSCPGHEHWVRDFTGSASVFSIVLQPHHEHERIVRFIDALQLFHVGYSWGGVTSLAMPCFELPRRFRPCEGTVVRLNIGLEAVDDLLADLEQGLAELQR